MQIFCCFTYNWHNPILSDMAIGFFQLSFLGLSVNKNLFLQNDCYVDTRE